MYLRQLITLALFTIPFATSAPNPQAFLDLNGLNGVLSPLLSGLDQVLEPAGGPSPRCWIAGRIFSHGNFGFLN